MLRHFIMTSWHSSPATSAVARCDDDGRTAVLRRLCAAYVSVAHPLRTGRSNGYVRGRHGVDHALPPYPDADGKFGHSTCAYSNPAFGQMFKMNAKTDTEGNVNSILVTIYDSLEQMYGDLCLDLELHSKSGFLKYKKDKSDVLMNFI